MAYDPGFEVGQNFKTVGDNAWGVNSWITPDYVQRMSSTRPELFKGISDPSSLVSANMMEGESNQQQWGWNLDPQLQSIFEGMTMQRRGAGGMKDGRTNAMYDQSGNLVYADTPYSYDPAKNTLQALLEGGALAAGAFGGLGLAGAGPWSGLADLFGGGAAAGGAAAAEGAAASSPYALSGGSFGASGAIGSTGMPALGAAGAGAAPGGLIGTGAGLGIGSTGAALGASGIGAGLGASLGAVGETALPAGFGLSGPGLSAPGLTPASSGNAFELSGAKFGNTASTGGLGSSGSGLVVKDAGAAAGAMGKGSSGSLTSYIDKLLSPKGVNALTSLAQIYSGVTQRNNAKELMGKVGNMGAYEQALRKQLERRDAAAGRRSQYGPREVELQAKLAELMSRNGPTLAALMQQQQGGMDRMLQGGLIGGKKLFDLFGG